MSRPYKLNETPTSPFSLRESGPLPEVEVAKKLHGRTYRTAAGKEPDTRATVDPTPCPNCGSLVEWALTAQRDPAGSPVRYVYARCRKSPTEHRWSLRRAAPTPPRAPIPPPRASVGSDVMGAWIENRIAALASELEKLKQIRALASELTRPGTTIQGVTSQIPPPAPSASNGKN